MTKDQSLKLINKITYETAREYKLCVSDILSRDRTQYTSYARHVAMSLSYEMANCTLADVARYFDRTFRAVSNANKLVTNRMQIDSDFVQHIKNIIKSVNNPETKS